MAVSILYVEDDELIREELGAFLRRYIGPENLLLAKDGAEGLELFEKFRPDLIVTDIIMPRMDGLEMIRRIREEDGEVPILMVTANSDSDFFIESIELQVNGYIPKPIDLDFLERKITSFLRDVRLRKAYESQKRLLEEIAQLQGNLLVVLDEELQPIFMNRRMMEFLGLSEGRDSRTKGRAFWKALRGKEDHLEMLERLRSETVTELVSAEGEVKNFTVDLVRIAESGHTLLSFSEVTRIMRERREYEYRAYHDTLTGLGNRFKCDRDSLERIFEAERKNRPFSLAVIDLDHFKRINDTYGHTAGDKVLRDFAAFLGTCANGKGELYRWGGEEFVLLMSDTPRESAVEFCEDLRKRIEAHPFSPLGLPLTASFGVAQLSVEGETPVELFNRADRALYRAKKKGRNRVETAVGPIGNTPQ